MLRYPYVAKGAVIGENRERNEEWYRRAVAASVLTTPVHDIVVDPTRGHGATLYDVDGNEYLDFGIVGADNFGFGPHLHAIRQGVYEVSPVPTLPAHDIYNAYGVLAMEELLKRTPVNGRGIVMAENSGTAANESAMKMVLKKLPGQKIFVNFRGAFHGRSFGPLCLLDPRKPERIEGYPKALETLTICFPEQSIPSVADRLRAELEDLPSEKLKHVCAVWLELIQGEGGIVIADPHAVHVLVDFFRSRGVAIAIDEVQTGMARTGTLWCYEQYGFLPDIVTVGKSLCGGYASFSAAIVVDRLNFRTKGEHASTFGMEPVRAASVLAALELIDREDYCGKARHIGETLFTALTAMGERTSAIRNVRGLGAMWGIEFANAYIRNKVLERACRLGVLTIPAGFPENPVIRIMPPLVIKEDELLLGLRVFEHAIHDCFPKLKK